MATLKTIREFLNNDPDLTAFVSWHVSVPDNEGSTFVEANFKVADCNRIVSLDFDMYGDDEDDINEKLDRLVTSAIEFRKTMKQALRISAKRRALKKKKKG